MFQSLLSFLLLLSSTSVFTSLVQADYAPFYNDEQYMNSIYGAYPRQRYISAPDIIAPVPNIVKFSETGLSPSKYVMWTPISPKLGPVHPMLLEAKTGTTVWQGPLHDWQGLNPTVQSCNGTDYITWHSGPGLKQGHSVGKGYLYNKNYNLMHTITGKNNKTVDCHELTLTPQCTVIFTSYDTIPYNLSHWNITEGYLMNSYFQEIDLATDELLFEWSAADHMNITDAIWQPATMGEGATLQKGFDFAHLNSVEKDQHGNYLLSMRHTSSVSYVSGVDGHVIWTLGGKSNDFKDLSEGSATDFAFQHHARWVNKELTKISIFDDRNSFEIFNRVHNDTRGIIVEIDADARTVRLDKVYHATHNITSVRMGGMQVLQDSPEPGNVILGYGNEPAWTEYAPNGTVLFDIALGPIRAGRASADNYRVLKVNWTGEPTWNPSIAAGPDAHYHFNETRSTFEVLRGDKFGNFFRNTTAYFSWNGATDIAYWLVLSSETSPNMTITSNFEARIPKTGFEMHYKASYGTKYLRAMAVSASDVIIGASPVLELAPGTTTEHVLDLALATLELSSAHLSAPKVKVINSVKGHLEGVKDHFDGVKNTVQGHVSQVSQVATQHPASASAAGIAACVAVVGMLLTCMICRSRRSRSYRWRLMALGRSRYRDVEYASDGDDSELDALSPRFEEKSKMAPSIRVVNVDGSESSSEGEDDEDFKVAQGYFDKDGHIKI